MTQLTINISGGEFNHDFIERIKAMLNGNLHEFEFFICVKPKETPADYFEKLDRSIAEADSSEQLVKFTAEEFEAFSKK